jgi:hypothetical protein
LAVQKRDDPGEGSGKREISRRIDATEFWPADTSPGPLLLVAGAVAKVPAHPTINCNNN